MNESVERENDGNILEIENLHLEFRSHGIWREVVKGVNFSL